MAERTKRRRLETHSDAHSSAQMLDPAANIDKVNWEGFVEIESDPALFNVMLLEMGVQGVKVQEVFSLDEEMLDFLPKPIHGLIFLFRWQEDETVSQQASCPEGLWFANQTVKDACATVALLNIVNNIDGAELGSNLQHFKEFTKDFSPALRGDAIGNFEFLKRIHNSFARKMDMLNVDLALHNEILDQKKKSKGKTEEVDEAGFHFIAFVPFESSVWQFDGLERQPKNLGSFTGDNWLARAKPVILDRMASYEQDQIEFSILGLVADPYQRIKMELAINVKSIKVIQAKLSESGSAADLVALEENGTITSFDPSFDLAEADLDNAALSALLTDGSHDIEIREDLQSACEKLVHDQRELRASLREEQQARQTDLERATGRRHDYGPAIQAWARALARKEMAEELIAGSWG